MTTQLYSQIDLIKGRAVHRISLTPVLYLIFERITTDKPVTP